MAYAPKSLTRVWSTRWEVRVKLVLLLSVNGMEATSRNFHVRDKQNHELGPGRLDESRGSFTVTVPKDQSKGVYNINRIN